MQTIDTDIAAIAAIIDAIALLQQECPRLENEPQAAQHIAALCGYEPLAMRLCAATLQHHPAIAGTQLCALLVQEQTATHTAIETATRGCYLLLDEATRYAVAQLALFPAPCDAAALHICFQRHCYATRHTAAMSWSAQVALLCACTLLTWQHESARYAMHPDIRAAIRCISLPSIRHDRHNIALRHCRYYLAKGIERAHDHNVSDDESEWQHIATAWRWLARQPLTPRYDTLRVAFVAGTAYHAKQHITWHNYSACVDSAWQAMKRLRQSFLYPFFSAHYAAALLLLWHATGEVHYHRGNTQNALMCYHRALQHHTHLLPFPTIPLPPPRECSPHAQLRVWDTLLFIAIAETIGITTTTIPGTIAYTVAHVMLLLWLHSRVATGIFDATRRALYALTLVPLARLMMAAYPGATMLASVGNLIPPLAMLLQPGIALLTWQTLTTALLLLATTVMMYTLRLSPRDIGIGVGTWQRTVVSVPLLVVIGVGAGVVDYVLFTPRPLVVDVSWKNMAVAMGLLLFSSGVVEEVVLRGIIQRVLLAPLGLWALFYSALLFGILHVTRGSLPLVMCMIVVGLCYAFVVHWSGSLLGVVLAHTVQRIVALLWLPHWW